MHVSTWVSSMRRHRGVPGKESEEQTGPAPCLLCPWRGGLRAATPSPTPGTGPARGRGWQGEPRPGHTAASAPRTVGQAGLWEDRYQRWHVKSLAARVNTRETEDGNSPDENQAALHSRTLSLMWRPASGTAGSRSPSMSLGVCLSAPPFCVCILGGDDPSSALGPLESCD